MSDDVDPTGDRTYRGGEEQPITAKRVLAEDQSAEIFSDLRYEVALAARRHAEISSALDIYADELSHIAFAVVGDREGIVGFHQIVDHVKAVVAERDRLKAVVRKVVVCAGIALEGKSDEWLSYVCDEYTGLHEFDPDELTAYRRALDVPPTGEDNVSDDDGRVMAWEWRERALAAEAERDRLTEQLAHEMNAGQSMEGNYHDLKDERDRLRAVVAHAVETLSESAPGAPGVLATVDLMRLALDPTREDT